MISIVLLHYKHILTMPMFSSKYTALPQKDAENVLTASLPPVLCSALSASLLMDHESSAAAPSSSHRIAFSALSSAILDQRREREMAAAASSDQQRSNNRRKQPAAAAKENDAVATTRRRRRHPAGDMKAAEQPATVVSDDVLEPLVTSLRLHDEVRVALKHLGNFDNIK